MIGPLGALLAVPLSLFAKALLVDADPDSRAALFVVISGGADPGRAIEALAPLGPWVLRTNLDPAAEQRLLAAFTEPAPRPGSTSPSPPASE